MVLEFDASETLEDARSIENVADGLEDAARRTAADDRTIMSGVEDAVEESLSAVVVPQAKRAAQPHVGDHASEIRKGEGTWQGKHYRNGLVADSDVVLAHEYGTGVHRGGSRYRIPARTDSGPVAIDVGGETKVVEYVRHPGVDEEAFMRESMDRSLDVVGENMVEEVGDRLDRALDPL